MWLRHVAPQIKLRIPVEFPGVSKIARGFAVWIFNNCKLRIPVKFPGGVENFTEIHSLNLKSFTGIRRGETSVKFPPGNVRHVPEKRRPRPLSQTTFRLNNAISKTPIFKNFPLTGKMLKRERHSLLGGAARKKSFCRVFLGRNFALFWTTIF